MAKLIFFESIIAYCNIQDVHAVQYFSTGICNGNPLLAEAAAADVTVMIQVIYFSGVFYKDSDFQN